LLVDDPLVDELPARELLELTDVLDDVLDSKLDDALELPLDGPKLSLLLVATLPVLDPELRLELELEPELIGDTVTVLDTYTVLAVLTGHIFSSLVNVMTMTWPSARRTRHAARSAARRNVKAIDVAIGKAKLMRTKRRVGRRAPPAEDEACYVPRARREFQARGGMELERGLIYARRSMGGMGS
jgi:hypothetical protein